MKQYLKLYQDCVLVKGFTRSLLYDLSNNCIYNVPSDCIMTLESLNNGLILEDSHMKNEFICSLLKNEIIFKTSIPFSFPAINTIYSDNHIVETLIINWSNINFKKLEKNILPKLLDFICITNIEYLFIVVDNQIDVLLNLLDYLVDSPIRCIEICISSALKKEAKDLLEKLNRIKRIFVTNCDTDKIEQIYSDSYVIYTSESINFEGVSPIITQNNFIINRLNYIESQSKNLFYNKKLFFNDEYILSIFPNSEESFKFCDLSNEEIVTKILQSFDLWDIKKDNVVICKDCEYRYMCNDPRNNFTTNEDGLIVFKDLCSFNPYI